MRVLVSCRKSRMARCENSRVWFMLRPRSSIFATEVFADARRGRRARTLRRDGREKRKFADSFRPGKKDDDRL